MKLMFGTKDGGPESRVYMYGLEIKSLFTIALLRFEHGSREAYHSHAFNCVSLVLSGQLAEYHRASGSQRWVSSGVQLHNPFSVIWTYRDTFHKVYSNGRSWVLTFRGPWARTWREEAGGREYGLTHGRVELP